MFSCSSSPSVKETKICRVPEFLLRLIFLQSPSSQPKKLSVAASHHFPLTARRIAHTTCTMAISNGVTNAMPQKGSFLFTSESVGEGHPDKIWCVLPNTSCHEHSTDIPAVTRSQTLSLTLASERTLSPRYVDLEPLTEPNLTVTGCMRISHQDWYDHGLRRNHYKSQTRLPEGHPQRHQRHRL